MKKLDKEGFVKWGEQRLFQFLSNETAARFCIAFVLFDFLKFINCS